MTVGITAYLANKLLDHVFRNVTYAPPAIVYFKAHTGDPGAAGTANPSSNATRYALTFGAASSGQIAITAYPEHTLSGSETISHGSIWDHPTAGNCLITGQATVSKAGISGDIIRLASDVISLTPIAT
ncbi:phage tail fiber protein [Mycolicibacterium conceptionense]|uniref:phage tail fiber protein n=1 Tax=Mycolicibacterium conceptionense TaxID=451644 RepID=UPI00096EE58A|nr:hypothetical protein [Mycolicibacterium conceptionense]OMB79295.1 hypothetical protein A5743_14440 [Mycolicibacterium conceptionense]